MARVLNTKPPPDFLVECKEMGRCRRFLTDVDQMNQKERTFYESRIEAWELSFNSAEMWGPVIAAYLKKSYKHTRIIG